jgi:hypothetical protein
MTTQTIHGHDAHLFVESRYVTETQHFLVRPRSTLSSSAHAAQTNTKTGNAYLTRNPHSIPEM